MDPMTGIALASLALSAGSAIAGGVAGKREAEGEALRNDINAYIGRTNALEVSASAREGLDSELGSMRSVFAANGARPDSSTFDLLSQVRDVRDSERRIDVANVEAGIDDSQIAARNARQRGNAALIRGFGRAGMSLFDMGQTIRGPR